MPNKLGPRLRLLRQLLARLYPSERDLKRVLSDVGIGIDEIPGGDSALNLWHEALKVVLRHRVLRSLIEIASEDYPPEAAFLAEYLAGIAPYLPGARTPERLKQLVTEAAAATSEVLDWPSTLASGATIARPEHLAIRQHIADPEVAVVVVLGEAGCGKSALLAGLGRELREDGTIVLGARLDRLAKNVVTDEDLQRYLGLSEPFVDLAEAVASLGAVVVFIDQLDALCDLMTERAGRLALILETIEGLAAIENVHVVIATRPFEYRHDVRFRSVSAVEVTLALPQWSDVEPHIVAGGIDAAGMPADLREELRVPQALNTFLELTKEGKDYGELTTYYAMRERLWDSHINQAPDAARRRQVLFDLARWMATEEVLTRPMAQMDGWRAEIGVLESAGWLKRVGLASNAGVSFRHQSLFDFAYARAMVASGGAALEQVLQHQGLSVRRRVWAVLSYLREASRDQYVRELERLWHAPNLRRHLKRLLIAFLGQRANPDPREIDLFRAAIEDPAWRLQALVAAGNGAGWYVHLSERELPRAMSDRALAYACIPILAKAPDDQRGKLLKLLDAHWMADPHGIACATTVVASIPEWSDEVFAIALRIVTKIPFKENYRVEQLVSAILPQSPERATALVAAAVQAEVIRELRVLRTTPEPPRLSNDAEWAQKWERHRMMTERGEPIRRLMDASMHWTSLADLVNAAPELLLNAIWPIMLQALEAVAESQGELFSFRGDMGWKDAIQRKEGGLLEHVQDALITMAKTNPEKFVEFLGIEERSDLMTVHELLIPGLSEVAARRPDAICEYFSGDGRRLLVGATLDSGHVTLQCITRASAVLDATWQQQLADLFMRWKPLKVTPPEWEPKHKWRHLQFVRHHRLRLLLCLDMKKLSRSTQARIEEEQRSFPDIKRYSEPAPDSHTLGAVNSRMRVQHMERASDQEILKFFASLPDESGWHHPLRFGEGGSIEASRELAQLSEKNPARGLRLAASFSSTTHQRPVGMVIEAVAKAGFDSETIFKFIERCEAGGFNSAGYRTDVADALQVVGRRDERVGLPDTICQLLRSWLTDGEGDGRNSDSKRKSGPKPQRILFQPGAGDPLPEGNFRILGAITIGLLNRESPAFEVWMTILEEHVNRREEPRVWQALAYHDLWYLAGADRVRAAALLKTLFHRFPELLDVTQGLYLVDRHMGWLPNEMTRGWMDALRKRGTRWHAQAFGELLVLRAYRLPKDSWSIAEIERLIEASDAVEELLVAERDGVALMSAVAVRDEVLFGLADRWLVRLGGTEQPAIGLAVLDALTHREQPPYDERVEALLGVLEAHPAHLRQDHLDGLLRALQAYVRHTPGRVIRLANAIIDTFQQELGDMRFHAAAWAADLVDLALTLQDIPGREEAGLELFERLQELNLSEVEAVLNEQEVQPTNTSSIRTRPRGRPGRKKKR